MSSTARARCDDANGARIVGHEELRDLSVAALVRAGVAVPHAELIADSALDSELGGRSSHGIVRIAGYLKKAEQGGIDRHAEPAVIRDHGAVFAIDARNGFGQLALALAVDMAVDRALRHGIACGTIRNLNNAGALGYFARRATKAGQIAILGGNATPAMPPHGGRTAKLGTNPFCVAVPAASAPDPVLDMATTAASKGTIRMAARRGTPIPRTGRSPRRVRRRPIRPPRSRAAVAVRRRERLRPRADGRDTFRRPRRRRRE
jgi:LDH2 family malate/lactate/ureidoglycolate dehydrogenase